MAPKFFEQNYFLTKLSYEGIRQFGPKINRVQKVYLEQCLHLRLGPKLIVF